MNKHSHKPKGFPVVTGIFIIFLIPLCLAWLLYHQHYLGQTTNIGKLIKHHLTLQQLHYTNTPPKLTKPVWRLIVIDNTITCNQNCQTTLYKIRQVRTATGKNRNRVQRWHLSTHTPHYPHHWKQQHPDLLNYTITQPSLKHLVKHLPPQSTIIITDPLGNLVMAYPNNVTFKGLLKDLKHLLKVSQIG